MVIGRARLPIRLIALIACVCGACESGEAPPAPTTPPDLQVVSAGAEPRQLLRYHPAPGTTQTLEVTIDIDLEAGDMGGPMPSLVMTLSISVDALLPTQQVRLHATIEGVVARDTATSKVSATSLGPMLAPIKGIGFHALLSPDGRLSATYLDARSKGLAEGAQATLGSLVNSFEQAMMPLPDLPVGAGAVWRTSRPITRDGMTLTSVNSISVSSIKGSSITYTLDSTVHGADQRATEGSDSIDITDITGTSAGKGVLDLASLSVTSEAVAELRTTMSAPGDAEPTKMMMTTRTIVKPR